jgi:sugar phosphate isomerase/epimerase
MDKSKIAAQLFTLREYTKTPEDIEATLKKVADMGYESVQVSGIGPIEPERLKEFTDKAGLSICATHVSFDRIKNDTDALIKEHLLWNCKYMGLGAMPPKYRESADTYKAFAREMSEIAREVKAAGLQFIYHNHNFEFVKFDGITGLEILINESDPDAFHFEIDTYWVQAGGGDPAQWIKKVDGRMKVVHFKDMAMDKEKGQVFAEVGEGNLNWPSIIKACEDIGVEWYAVEQDICQRNPFESLSISLNNMIKMKAAD